MVELEPITGAENPIHSRCLKKRYNENGSSSGATIVEMLFFFGSFIVLVLWIGLLLVNLDTTTESSQNSSSANATMAAIEKVQDEEIKELTIKAIVKKFVATHKSTIAEPNTYIEKVNTALNNTNFDIDSFKQLNKNEQKQILNQLKEALPTEELYDFTPYITNVEKFRAYKKLHFINMNWVTIPYNQIDAIEPIGIGGIFAFDTLSKEKDGFLTLNPGVWETIKEKDGFLTLNPEVWGILSVNGEKQIDSNIFLDNLHFTLVDEELLAVIR